MKQIEVKKLRKVALLCGVFLLLLQMPAQAGPDYDQGVQLYNQHQYKSALPYFLRAATTEPKNAGTYFYAANCFYQLGNTERAIQTYNMVVKYYPGSPQAVMAQDFLNRLQSAKTPQKTDSEQKTDIASASTQSQHASAAVDTSPVNCTDLLEVVRPQKDHPPVSTELTEAMKSKLTDMPHDVGTLLHEHHIHVVIATSMPDAHPELLNEEGRGYEGNTFKSCPGMFNGRQVCLAERTLSESDESVRPAIPISNVLNTFAHECGHAVDFCLGEISATGPFTHVYLLDCGNLNRNSPETANDLRYFMQKAEAGQQECCGELIGVLIGKDDARGEKMRKAFPLTLKFLKGKLHMS